MSPYQSLTDELYREEVLRARGQTMEQKFMATLELSELAFEWGQAGVRAQMPGATEEELRKEWRRRMDIVRMLDDDGRWVPVKAPL